MSFSLDTLPLLSDDGDSFVIEVELHPLFVKISSIVRYPANQNSDGVLEKFFDLDPETRRAVIAQVNRRFKGKMIHT